MRVHEFLRYTQAFYPKWDPRYAEELRQQFSLEPTTRIRVLSKGQRAKLGLLAAQAHRPDLLLLDEPSSGLDPIVRNDILTAVIRTVTDEGRTVFFSSHLLEEIERVSDHIAMLHRGKVVLCGGLDDVKAQHRRITLQFEKPLSEAPRLSGAVTVNGAGRNWTVICNTPASVMRAIAADRAADIVDEGTASLNDIFVAYAGEPLAATSVA
jgi:ABC-2 type transport system ATP-binding protein